ncbi:MAG: hypothetical protein ACLSX2_11305, partial [Christensenellaceae bacterium]
AITDPERLCVNAAKAQLLAADALLCGGADQAQRIVSGYKPQYPSIPAYLAAIDQLFLEKDAVVYDEAGNARVDYQNEA